MAWKAALQAVGEPLAGCDLQQLAWQAAGKRLASTWQAGGKLAVFLASGFFEGFWAFKTYVFFTFLRFANPAQVPLCIILKGDKHMNRLACQASVLMARKIVASSFLEFYRRLVSQF